MILVDPFWLYTFCDSEMCHNTHVHTQTCMYHEIHTRGTHIAAPEHVLPLQLMFQTPWLNTQLGADLVLLAGQMPSTTLRLFCHSPLPSFKGQKGYRESQRDLPKSVQPHLRFSLDIKLHPVSSHGLISYRSYICRFGKLIVTELVQFV